MGGGMSQGGEVGGDLNPKLGVTEVPADDSLHHCLKKMYQAWILTGNVRNAAMEAQTRLRFQKRKAQLEDEANRLAHINGSIR